MDDAQERAKRAAGRAAADRVADGMVLGLGTGSTFRYVLERLGERILDEGLGVAGVPTSEATARLAREHGIAVTALEDHATLDLAIDGADEVDPALDLIKGGGGALVRERIVAAAAARLLVVVDEGKLVDRLGSTFAVPIEVIPLGWRQVRDRVAALGAEVGRRARGGEAVVTDNGNQILDARFPGIDDKPGLAAALRGIAGVVDHGLFLGMATEVLVADPRGDVRVVERSATTREPRAGARPGSQP